MIALLEAGVRCSLNADDPLLFGPGLLEEYELCRRTLGLTDGQLATIARASFSRKAWFSLAISTRLSTFSAASLVRRAI